MKPEIGQYVKCFLRNSSMLEGKVEEWNDTQVILKSLDDKNIIIIHAPIQDIMLTKVFIVIPEITKEKPISEIKQQIKQKLDEVQNTVDKDLNEKNISELKELVHEQDKQILFQKKKEHFGTIDNPKMTQYSPQVNYVPGNILPITEPNKQIDKMEKINGCIRFYKSARIK